MKLVCSESSRVCSGRAIWPQGENSCRTRTESGSTRRRSTVTPTVAVRMSPKAGVRGDRTSSTSISGASSAGCVCWSPLAAAEDEEEADGNGRQDEQRRRQDPPQRSCHPPQIAEVSPVEEGGEDVGGVARRDGHRVEAEPLELVDRATRAAPRSPPCRLAASRFVTRTSASRPDLGSRIGTTMPFTSGKLCSQVGS